MAHLFPILDTYTVHYIYWSTYKNTATSLKQRHQQAELSPILQQTSSK